MIDAQQAPTTSELVTLSRCTDTAHRYGRHWGWRSVYRCIHHPYWSVYGPRCEVDVPGERERGQLSMDACAFEGVLRVWCVTRVPFKKLSVPSRSKALDRRGPLPVWHPPPPPLPATTIHLRSSSQWSFTPVNVGNMRHLNLYFKCYSTE